MKGTFKKILSLFLIALTVLSFAACSGKKDGGDAGITEPITTTQPSYEKIGQGKHSFYLEIEFESGQKIYYEVFTDSEQFGETLKELKLIEGETGPDGMYILTVCGETHEYSENGKKFWELSVDGTPSPYKIDRIKLQDGEHYSFSVES